MIQLKCINIPIHFENVTKSFKYEYVVKIKYKHFNKIMSLISLIISFIVVSTLLSETENES